ncbi:nucleotide exchange factor GrpE [Furfurilactobacillus sp. WILCCON 0119]
MSHKDDSQTAEQAESASDTTTSQATDPTAKDIKKKPEAAVEQDEIAELTAQVAAMEDKYLRAQAEIANIQQRNQKETAQLMKYDGQQLAHDIVPELDNLERALQTPAEDEAAKQLQHGVQMVYDHLQAALAQNNVTEIESLNKPFDPTLHQAVQTVPVEAGQTPETVVTVLQKGYMLKDRVLRPAMVVVAQ